MVSSGGNNHLFQGLILFSTWILVWSVRLDGRVYSLLLLNWLCGFMFRFGFGFRALFFFWEGRSILCAWVC